MQLGIIGLGRMGANMARRLVRGGHAITVFDLDANRVREVASDGARGAESLDTLIQALPPPRTVWLMVPAGEPTEQMVSALATRLQAGDAITRSARECSLRCATNSAATPKGRQAMQSDVTVERTVQTPRRELAVERPARVADPATVVIFGATGDLAKRKLLPALYNLNADHLLPEGFCVVGLGREPLTTDAYREQVSRDLEQCGAMTTERVRCEWLESRLTYLAGPVDDSDTYDRLRNTLAAASLADGGRPPNAAIAIRADRRTTERGRAARRRQGVAPRRH